MMHLDDFDVVVRPEDGRDALGQAEQHVDADAHIGGDDDRRAPCGLGQRLAMFGAQAGCADDQRGAALLGVAGILEGGGGTGEVDDDVGHGEQLRRIIADANAGRCDAGERTQITADGEMAGLPRDRRPGLAPVVSSTVCISTSARPVRRSRQLRSA